jgi:hypothetical protein
MKKTFILIFYCLFIVSCSKSDDGNSNNPFLPNYAFDTGGLINTNLPLYNNLNFPGNHIILESPYGVNGVVVYFAGGELYSAFELSDPNHNLSACSKLTVEGVIANCSCDDGNAYDILSGSRVEGTTGQYTLKRYFVEANGNIIRVYNN